MDSKSISREGVGVRLPSLAPGGEAQVRAQQALRNAAREVGALLVPGLRAELRAATREIGELSRRLARDPGSALRDERVLERQERLRVHVVRSGWCLAAVGSLAGADLLGARRERAGLRWLVAAVAEARGRVLDPGADGLPLLRRNDEHASRTALLAAWAVLQAPGTGALGWSERTSGQEAWLEFECNAAQDRLAARCAELGPAAPSQPGLVLAHGWLRVGPL